MGSTWQHMNAACEPMGHEAGVFFLSFVPYLTVFHTSLQVLAQI